MLLITIPDYGPVKCIDYSAAGVFALLAIGVQLVADATLAAIAAQRIDALVLAAVVLLGAFVKLFDEIRGKASLLYGTANARRHGYCAGNWLISFMLSGGACDSGSGHTRQRRT